MLNSSKPWWMTDPYEGDAPIPNELRQLAGPRGLGLVQVYGERTQPGWGLVGPKQSEGFMPRYMRDEFAPNAALSAYNKQNQPFAFVMRSMAAMVVDIDGKNGGLDHALRLGNLPRTLSETSKSGNGYHLFYSTPEDLWDEDLGFAQFGDRIGIEQGVDIRFVGCVFHHSNQRWNDHPVVPMPDYLADVLRAKEQRQTAATERIVKIREGGDPMEIAMLEDELLTDLKKPIAQGKRNTTLFAIGQRMREAEVDAWDVILVDRALEVGLSQDEADKIVANINRYGGKA